MNDRFKFRVYSHEQKKMRYIDNFESGRDFYYGCFLDNRYFGEGCHTVMQSTGLKDRNGKLIYEGDIVNVNTGSRDTSGIGEVVYLQCGCKFVLNGFLEKPSGYYPRRKGEFNIDLQEWLCTEVIGNIYTTPELLEEQC